MSRRSLSIRPVLVTVGIMVVAVFPRGRGGANDYYQTEDGFLVIRTRHTYRLGWPMLCLKYTTYEWSATKGKENIPVTSTDMRALLSARIREAQTVLSLPKFARAAQARITELERMQQDPRASTWHLWWARLGLNTLPWMSIWGAEVLVRGWRARVRLKRRKSEGRCIRCAYDLRGSVESGRCPECGQPFDMSVKQGPPPAPQAKAGQKERSQPWR